MSKAKQSSTKNTDLAIEQIVSSFYEGQLFSSFELFLQGVDIHNHKMQVFKEKLVELANMAVQYTQKQDYIQEMVFDALSEDIKGKRAVDRFAQNDYLHATFEKAKALIDELFKQRVFKRVDSLKHVTQRNFQLMLKNKFRYCFIKCMLQVLETELKSKVEEESISELDGVGIFMLLTEVNNRVDGIHIAEVLLTQHSDYATINLPHYKVKMIYTAYAHTINEILSIVKSYPIVSLHIEDSDLSE